MRAWTISFLGILALSLAAPPVAEARPRLGPGALLGTVAAPLGMFSGARYSARHYRRGATRSLNEPSAEVFWPDAAADLVQYLIYPRGQSERFWTYDYAKILGAAFAAGPVADEVRGWRNRKVADGASALAGEADSSASACDRSATDADALIARIEEAIAPSAAQRGVLNELRIALVQVGERIEATCPAALVTPTQRLKAVQDRIWAMRDGLLTLRLPLEKFYASLSGDQYWRLNSEAPDARDNAPKSVRISTPTCSIPAPAVTEASMRAIERAVRPGPEQRASFEGLRLRSAAMSRLIGDSCPTYPLLGPLDRIAAAADRLDVMLFSVMTMSPILQQFHDSLDERQKRALAQTVRQFEQSTGPAGGRS
jgi:LTXXQ motif family protein